MKVAPIRTRVFKENEDLVRFITAHVPALRDRAVLVVTSKIAALADGRVVVAKHVKEKERIIRAESAWVLKTKYVWLTEKDGMILANAGVDESNADGKLILLPKDSLKLAEVLHKKLRAHYKIRKLGVIIADSRIMPLRAGVVGIALGYAGFRGLRDYRGKKDIHGRKLKFTQTNIADSLATAAALVMGEGNECQPLAIIEGAPVEFVEKVNRNELKVALKDDMYAPFFSRRRR